MTKRSSKHRKASVLLCSYKINELVKILILISFTERYKNNESMLILHLSSVEGNIISYNNFYKINQLTILVKVNIK